MTVKEVPSVKVKRKSPDNESAIFRFNIRILTDERRVERLRAGADDVDEWTWESYTPGSSEEEMVVVVEKKKKKGKDKDKKKEVESIAETPVTASAAPAPADAVQPGGKKKEKKISPEVLAEMARQAELEAKQAEEEQRLREKMEFKNAKAKQKKETIEQALRMEQLHASLQVIEHVVRRNVDAVQLERMEVEWVQYLKCDGLPDPYVCKQMNTYLSMWVEKIDETTMDEASFRTLEVLKLMDDVTGFIESPLGAARQQIDNWKWVRRLFRHNQQKSLDIACYKILRDVSKRMSALNLEKYDYRRVERNFTVCLWTMVELPTPLPNPRAPARLRTDLQFPELNLQLVLPLVVNCYRLAVRAMYVSYDHLSDLCATHDEPPTPEDHKLDICQINREEWYSKLIFKYDEYRRIKKKQGEKIPPQEYDRATGVMPEVSYIKMPVSPSTHVIAQEAEKYIQMREALITVVDNDVISLRKYVIIGGVFYLNLYFQPPQPQYCVSMEINISRLYVPKTLQEVNFCAPYTPVPPAAPDKKRTTAELEAEAKKQELELDKLIFVSLQLPTHVMWLDTPTVCQWNEDKRVWSTVDVHDFRFLEETTSVTFRTSRFGLFSFAMSRFTNLPYQTWEIKPEANGTVTVQLVAAILTLDFNVRENNIAITKIQNSPNKALKEHLGKYYKLARLKRVLLEIGIDVFPFFDAFCYVENSCEKHWQMEKHLYFQMAQVSACYNFTWSRWNTVAGRRSIILQMREFKFGKTKQPSFNMLQVTPLKAEYISCSEVSSEFFPEAVEGMAFYSDLYSLVKGICTIVVRNKIQNTSPLLIGTVAELLQSMRILSFS